jgi:D-inositol-3-phosphate glycosyltransferase
MTKRRLLWVGDAGVATGFERCTRRMLPEVSKKFDVHVLAIGYDGDPHTMKDDAGRPYELYPAVTGGDGLGIGRMTELIGKLGPSVCVIQNDPWNFPRYLPRAGNCPVVGIVAVDGKNCRGTMLNGLASAIFWTQFGAEQARLGGYSGPTAVVPLGVDLDIYRPLDKAAIRERMQLPQILAARGLPEDTFIVGVVGRNHLRKRLDLTVRYFAEWVHSRKIADAALWVQQAPTGDSAFDLLQLGHYYHIADRLILPHVDSKSLQGVPEPVLARIYNVFDAMLTTTQGEGWGLPCMEGMACGVPQIVPDWAALAEWTQEAVLRVPCTTFAATPGGVNVIGGIADELMTIGALDRLYRDKEACTELTRAGLALVSLPEYRWPAIGSAICAEVERALYVSSQPAAAAIEKQEQPC